MSEIKALNYQSVGIYGNNQLGSNNKVQNEQTDYSDGLSKKELQQIDKNKDGIITEQEFKAACVAEGVLEKNTELYWDNLTAFTKAMSKKDKNGNTTVTQNIKSNTVDTVVDAAGNALSTTTTQSFGESNTTNYNANGVKTSTVVTSKDGTITTTEYDENGNVTGTTIRTNYGKIRETKLDANGNVISKTVIEDNPEESSILKEIDDLQDKIMNSTNNKDFFSTVAEQDKLYGKLFTIKMNKTEDTGLKSFYKLLIEQFEELAKDDEEIANETDEAKQQEKNG